MSEREDVDVKQELYELNPHLQRPRPARWRVAAFYACVFVAALLGCRVRFVRQ